MPPNTTSPLKPVDERIQRIKLINQQKGIKTLEQKRHDDLMIASFEEREVILKSFRELINYLGNRIGKVEIVNQLKEIGTPDALKVVAAVEAFHKEFKKKKDIDLSEVTNVLKLVLAQAEAIPKSLPDLNIPDPIDNSAQLQAIETAVKTLTAELKKKDLNVEAPNVTVEAPNVQVEAPDLTPFSDTITKAFSKAIKAIVFPEYKTDNAGVEKLLKQTNKLLDEIADISSRGGSSAGGRATPYEDAAGKPIFVELTPDGKVPVEAGGTSAYALRMDQGATYTYIGEAVPGTTNSDAVWRIKRMTNADTTIVWAGGASSFVNIWDDRASLTYS